MGYQGYRGAGHHDFRASLHIQVPLEALATVYPQEFGQVKINLVENACAAIHDRCAVDPTHEPVLTVTLENNLGVTQRLSVQDNGHGISPDLTDRIFEPPAKELG